MIKGIVITIALELLLPVIAGLYFAVRGSEDSDPKTLFLARAYTSGQILLFALFRLFLDLFRLNIAENCFGSVCHMQFSFSILNRSSTGSVCSVVSRTTASPDSPRVRK